MRQRFKEPDEHATIVNHEIGRTVHGGRCSKGHIRMHMFTHTHTHMNSTPMEIIVVNLIMLEGCALSIICAKFDGHKTRDKRGFGLDDPCIVARRMDEKEKRDAEADVLCTKCAEERLEGEGSSLSGKRVSESGGERTRTRWEGALT